MQQRHSHLASVAVLCAALLAPSLAAAQSMTLTLPYRGAGAKQTASTVVEFDATTINVGATITVATKLINVPGTGCAGVTCSNSDLTPGGDAIEVLRLPGTERVRVILTYLSSFGGVPAYCVDNAFITKTYDFTLAGFSFGSGKGYRIASFMAPSAANCEFAYARVPSTTPSFPNGSPINRIGRLPLSVVLVLDKSGSMSDPVPGSSDIRFDRLKSSVDQFVKVWQVAGMPPLGSDGNVDDKLGVVLFDSTTTDGSLGGVFFKARGNSSTPWQAEVNTAVGTVGTGATSIGGGISRARVKLGEVALIDGDTATILFTDGEQNRTPCVIREQETLSVRCNVSVPKPANKLVLSNAPGTLLAKTLPRGPVFTIGLGEGSGPFADLLDLIALETAGRARITPNGSAMDAAFVDALVSALRGSTMSVLVRDKGTVPANASQSPPIPVLIDDSVRRAIFVARWNGRGNPLLEIRRPDGTVVTNATLQPGNLLIVAGVDIAPGAGVDPWQIRVVRPQGASNREAADFDFTALAVDPKLSYRVTETPSTGTGKPIVVSAEIGWEGVGLSGLPPGSVRVRVLRPGENLGNILFNSESRGDPRSPAGDEQDALRAKLDALNGGGSLASRIDPKEAATVPMNDLGLGRYEAEFSATSIGGQYKFVVELDWNIPQTGRIKRMELAERQVPVVPTASGTEVRTDRLLNGDAVLVITPRDSFGNYVGPGYANQFEITVAGAALGQITDPSTRGIYEVTVLGVPPGPPGDPGPQVTIKYRGQTLVTGRLWRFFGGRAYVPGTPGNKAVWLGFGSTYPHGSFSNGYDRDLAFNAGFEYGLGNGWAAEATIGRHEFEGKNGAPNLEAMHYGLNAKYYFAMQNPGWRPFLTGGIGAYDFDPGSTQFGASLGVGAQFDINPQWAIEGRYGYHWISGNSPNSQYSTLLIGLRFAF